MGLFDTIKGFAKGHKKEIDKGVDAAAKLAKQKAPDSMDSKIDTGAAQVKKVVNKLPD
jgi:hypothetical protein